MLIVFAALFSTGATAAQFKAGLDRPIRERCHMDLCSFSTISTSQPVKVFDDGVLFAQTGQNWTAEYRPRGGTTDYDFAPIRVNPRQGFKWMVFCSKTRPYMFYQSEGDWNAVPLRPGDNEAMAGSSETAYSDYWAACHNFFPRSPIAIGGVAERLGYHFAGGWPGGNQPTAVTGPSDLR